MYINYSEALDVFKKYVSLQKEGLEKDKLDLDLVKSRAALMDKKFIHSLEVVTDGEKVVNQLNFNESVISFAKVVFLDHDIGRFSQMRYTGTFLDDDLHKYNIINHGQLGKYVLSEGIIKKQIFTTRIFDDAIEIIVNDHVSKINDLTEFAILKQTVLKDEDIFDLFKNGSDKIKKSIITLVTQIVQDVDRLDILHQILFDRWNPLKERKEISVKVFDMFYKGEYLNISNLKKQGLWNKNVGELVRLSFINQIKLLSVAKMIYEENLILKLKEKRQNIYVQDAFEYTNELLKQMIENSEDGIIVGKVKKYK